MARRNDIPSLTGLRGIAALLVVIAHTDGFFVAPQPAWLEYAWRVCASLGMTTFFVLSGFVIHYNYGASIAAKGAPAIRSFLIARFARLYPLYMLVLLITIVLTPSIVRENAFPQWCWRYLTMTQDWTPTLIDDKLVATLYIGSAWSISAEAGLYLFYLVAATLLDGMRTVRAALCAIGTLSIAGTIFAAGHAAGLWFGALPHQEWWLHFPQFAARPNFCSELWSRSFTSSARICEARVGPGSPELVGWLPRLGSVSCCQISNSFLASLRALLR